MVRYLLLRRRHEIIRSDSQGGRAWATYYLQVVSSIAPLFGEPIQTSHKSSVPKVRFGTGDEFHKTLKRKVDRYFGITGRSPRDCPRMYVKTGIVLAWAIGSYLLLLLVVSQWWLAVPIAISLGLSLAA